MSLGKALQPQMLHLTLEEMSTWWDGDVNVYDKHDKYIAPKWLQDCMLSVELKWHMDEQVE